MDGAPSANAPGELAHAPIASAGRSAAEQEQDELRPIIPIGWRWVLGIYFGVPVLLVVLRPEIWPNTTAEWIRHIGTTIVATVGIGGLVHAVYAWPMPRLLRKLSSTPARLALHVVAITASVSLGKKLVRPLIDQLCAPEMQKLREDPGRELLIAVTAAMVVVAAATYFTQLQQRARRVEQLEAEARQAALAARLEALRARTNPHFLFNSLNTVASLIAVDPECAEQTVERLSDLLRYTLQSARRPHVKLADEIEVVRDYLDIEQLRLGERLSYAIDIEPALDGLRVPPLILQPLVENAVLHGVSAKRSGGEVLVSATQRGEEVLLRVRDRSDEPPTHKHKGTGTALADLQRRLELAFGSAAELIREQTDSGYCVTLKLPVEGSES